MFSTLHLLTSYNQYLGQGCGDPGYDGGHPVLPPPSLPPLYLPPHHGYHYTQPVIPIPQPVDFKTGVRGSARRVRSEKKPIPEEQKDERYYERRKRNNQAAKKSRDARRLREDQTALRASMLEQENAILRAQVLTLREEAHSLRQLLLQKKSKEPLDDNGSEKRFSASQTQMTSDLKFRPEQVDEVADIFVSFAGSQAGCGEVRMEKKYMPVFLRGLGLDPTETELEEIWEDFDVDRTGSIGLHQLGKFLELLLRKRSSKLELLRGYRLFDKESKGFISMEDMRRAAATAGQNMNDIELEELMSAADVKKTGVVSKKDFINFMKVVHFSLEDI